MSPSLLPPRRRRRTLNEAQDLIAQWRSSGQTQAVWCQAQGIQPVTLRWYVKRVNQAVPRGFIAVHPRGLPADDAVSALVLEFGDGLRVTGLQIAEVAILVRALREQAS